MYALFAAAIGEPWMIIQAFILVEKIREKTSPRPDNRIAAEEPESARLRPLELEELGICVPVVAMLFFFKPLEILICGVSPLLFGYLKRSSMNFLETSKGLV